MSGYGFSVGSSGYDEEDRLVNRQRTDTNLDQSWNLSAVGNWNISPRTPAPKQNRTHGPTHEPLTVASQSVTHDAKGPGRRHPVIFANSLGHFINDVYRFLCVRKPDYPTFILKGNRPLPATMAPASLVVTIQQQS